MFATDGLAARSATEVMDYVRTPVDNRPLKVNEATTIRAARSTTRAGSSSKNHWRRHGPARHHERPSHWTSGGKAIKGIPYP